MVVTARRRILAGAVLCTLLLLWEGSYVLFDLSTQVIPKPSSLATLFFQLLASGELVRHAFASVERVGVGFSLAAVAAVSLALLCASLNKLQRVVHPIVEILRPIPPIAWIPLAIIFFGLGAPSAYFIVFIGAFFPIFSNAYFGAASLPKKYRNLARTLGLKRGRYLKDILFPQALPNVFTGLRIGIGMAWMSVIAAEMIGAQSGLGYFIQMSRLMLATDQVIIGMFVIGMIGFLLQVLMIRWERASVPWSEHDQDP